MLSECPADACLRKLLQVAVASVTFGSGQVVVYSVDRPSTVQITISRSGAIVSQFDAIIVSDLGPPIAEKMAFIGETILPYITPFNVRGLGTAGTVVFQVETFNVFGQAIIEPGRANASDFDVSAIGPSEAVVSVRETCAKPPCRATFWYGEAPVGGVFEITFTATRSGTYNVNVFYQGAAVAGGNGRVSFLVNPAPPSPSTSRAIGKDMSSAIAGITGQISLRSFDQYSNPINSYTLANYGVYTIAFETCLGQLACDVNAQVVLPSQNAPFVQYHVTASSTYRYRIYMQQSGAPVLIMGSASAQPFVTRVSPAPTVTVGCTFSPVIPLATAGAAVQFLISTRDAFGNTQTGGSEVFSVLVAGQKRIQAESQPTNSPGQYSISLMDEVAVTQSGQYIVSIVRYEGSGQSHLSGSPFRMELIPARPAPFSIRGDGDGVVFSLAASRQRLCVVSEDPYGNWRPLTRVEAGQLVIKATGVSTDPRWPLVQCSSFPPFERVVNSFGETLRWCAEYSCRQPGRALIAVEYNNTANITGSPFTVNVRLREAPKLKSAIFDASGASFTGGSDDAIGACGFDPLQGMLVFFSCGCNACSRGDLPPHTSALRTHLVLHSTHVRVKS